MRIGRAHSKAWKFLAVLGLFDIGATLSARAQPSGFWLMGFPEGGTASGVTAFSQDGSVAGGGSYIPATDTSASFRWTVQSGRDDWGLLPGMPNRNIVYASDSSGQIVAGDMFIIGQGYRPFRRVRTGDLENLGVLPTASRSFANGISGDGMIVVGYCETGPNSHEYGEAFRWTPTGGMKGLGHLTLWSFLSEARAISRDGSTIVGQNVNEVLWYQAFTWTEVGGMKALPTLTGAPSSGAANAVNADGTVVVGSSTSANGYPHATRWVNGLPQDLAVPVFLGSSLAYSVNDDGRVVGGATSSSAFIWSEAAGMMTAKDYLASHGITVPAGYKLDYVLAVSGDGLTFGGYAKKLSTNQTEGWVATVPGKACVADCDASGSLDIDDFICFQTRYAIADPYADCDASGALDIDDFICFQTLFAVGC